MELPNLDKILSLKSNPKEFTTFSAQMELMSTRDIVKWALNTFDTSIALASSFGAEDVVIIDMMCDIKGKKTKVFTLDTGRLNQETYDLIEKIKERYEIEIIFLFPNKDEVEAMLKESGPNLMYKNVENRKYCCQVRKVEPLGRALLDLNCWITGLRREQSVSRSNTKKIEIDTANNDILKLNPLADWTNEQVWEYIRTNEVPYNKLHDLGYPSIGCEPCTRAVGPNDDPRSGRWWWEESTVKECGLHWVTAGKARDKK
ncbi:MAG: phosphoadenylyl-sulfate reductase [Nitrososphaeraceae archaeon]